MAAEANAWKVMYGRKMNTEYLTLMENVMEQIEDLSRRLSRPIKDLDDVRQAMATLKEIREKEIYIDSCLGPVEVGTDPLDHIGMSECMSSIKIEIFLRSRTLCWPSLGSKWQGRRRKRSTRSATPGKSCKH